ncbi:MAG: hypothetical protein RIQ94_113 [Pseudomonadota bacterium]|jgi:O-antigen/teichoic acid export membrane protein
MNRSPKEKSLSSVISKYAKSSLFSKLSDLIYAYAKPKLLTPEGVGLWNLLSLIISLSGYSHLGSFLTIRYVVPRLEQEKKTEEIIVIKNTVYTGTLFITLLISISLIIYAFVGNNNSINQLGFVTVAGLVLLYWYYSFLIEILKSHQKFKYITSSNYLMSGIRLVVGIYLTYKLGIYGVFISTILVIFSAIFYIRCKYKDNINISFDKTVFINLIRNGFPIMLYGIIIFILISVDRVLISYFLDLKQVGYYSIAILVTGIMLKIPSSAREVIEPLMSQHAGLYQAEKTISEYYFKPLYNTAYYCSFFFIGAFFLLPVVLPLILSDYLKGTAAAQILSFGINFIALSFTSRGLIVLNNWQLKATKIGLIAITLNIALNCYFLIKGYGIEGVAVGSSLSYFSLFFMLYIFLAVKFKEISISFFKHFLYIIAPLLFSIIISLLIDGFSQRYFYYYNHYFLKVAGFVLAMFFSYSLIYIASKRNKLIYFYSFGIK